MIILLLAVSLVSRDFFLRRSYRIELRQRKRLSTKDLLGASPRVSFHATREQQRLDRSVWTDFIVVVGIRVRVLIEGTR
eukprot:scaffold37458_cov176-Amphora_coffeaeformis.AAC.4